VNKLFFDRADLSPGKESLPKAHTYSHPGLTCQILSHHPFLLVWLCPDGISGKKQGKKKTKPKPQKLLIK